MVPKKKILFLFFFGLKQALHRIKLFQNKDQSSVLLAFYPQMFWTSEAPSAAAVAVGAPGLFSVLFFFLMALRRSRVPGR